MRDREREREKKKKKKNSWQLRRGSVLCHAPCVTTCAVRPCAMYCGRCHGGPVAVDPGRRGPMGRGFAFCLLGCGFVVFPSLAADPAKDRACVCSLCSCAR